MRLPKYLQEVLVTVSNNEGEDINFALGHLPVSTARSYMSRLKRLGLAYTHTSDGTTEVWTHPKGRALIAAGFTKQQSRSI